MPARRREFTVGEVVGNGWTVISPDRIRMPINGIHDYTLGVRVRCHCGKPFTVSITNFRTQLGC
jgi:hypothetical protein